MTAQKLTHRYLFALTLVALLASALFGLAHWATARGNEDAGLVNMAGRQRMLSQRIPLLARDHDNRAEQAEAALAMMQTSHERLVGLAPSDDRLDAIYSTEGEAVDARTRSFIEAARAVIAGSPAAPSLPELEAMSEALLPGLDLATNGFETVARNRMAGYQRLETLAFVVTLFILAAEALLIFRPAAREIGRTVEALTSARDRADRANAAKSDFLAQMSHEIRTPLNGVLGMATALKDTHLDEAQTRMVGTIAASGDLLLSVVNDVLDLSKIEAGELDLETIEVSMEQVVDWTVSAFRPACEDKGLSLDASVDTSARGWYRGDPTRMRQILSNLVGNAIKFTQVGSITISVRTSRGRSEDEDRVEICVADTGIGVPAHKLQSIFSPFTQADSSTTRAYGGTGLGLPICHRLAEMMGGGISVRSREGCGSIFTVVLYLPRTAAPAAPAAAAPAMNIDHRLRVLIVDDVATNRLVLQTMLVKYNVESVQAASGLEAIATCEMQGDIDVVLMDVQMPDMDGIETTRRIRAMEARDGRAPTPIVAVTANVLTEQIAEYRQAGMTRHLAKPIDPRKLEGLLSALRSELADPASVEPDRRHSA